MLRLNRKGPGWQIVTECGSVELPEDQARAFASRILAEGKREGETIGNETQSRRVSRLVQQDIASGFFRAGQRLDEVTLANRYGVSRTPVREALTGLTVAGAVTREPHKGCRVAAVKVGSGHARS